MYGLPSKISEGDPLISGETKEMKTARIKRNKVINRRARIGFIFLILGLAFQLIGSNIIL